jgi:predicted esterase
MHAFAHVLAGLVLAAAASPAPAPAHASSPATGQAVAIDRIVPGLAAAAAPTQHYALYLPPGYPGTRRWPVLVIADPRGRAEATLALAVDGARRNGWVVLSAEGSRSDAPQAATLAALQALLVDATQRYASDPRRFYLAGMSGTAKSLWPVAAHLRGRVAGLVGCAGAPAAREALQRPAPAFFGCSGTRDFNHAAMRALDATLARGGGAHRLQVFAGPHGWPPDLGEAIDWLQLQAMRDGLAPRDGARIDALFGQARARAAEAASPLARWRELDQALRDFDGLRDVGSLRTDLAAAAADPALPAARAAEARLLDAERRYQRVADAWFERMAPVRGADRAGAPPTRDESLRLLQVAALRRLARDPDPAVADSAWRRLALARAAAGNYAPARARAAGDEATARAALAVADAIGPVAPAD